MFNNINKMSLMVVIFSLLLYIMIFVANQLFCIIFIIALKKVRIVIVIISLKMKLF
jgi:hypothetical protein